MLIVTLGCVLVTTKHALLDLWLSTLGERSGLPSIRGSTSQIFNYYDLFVKTRDVISFELYNKILLNIWIRNSIINIFGKLRETGWHSCGPTVVNPALGLHTLERCRHQSFQVIVCHLNQLVVWMHAVQYDHVFLGLRLQFAVKLMSILCQQNFVSV